MSILLQRAAILIMRYSYVGIKWIDDFLGVKANPGAELVDLLKNKPHTPPPPGMPDENNKGEYPEGSTKKLLS